MNNNNNNTTNVQFGKKRLFKSIDAFLIDTGALLGSGQYGNVYKGYEQRNVGKLYAIKETPISNASSHIIKKKKIAAIQEINSLRSLNHPHIIKFITAKQTNQHLYLMMEYCEGGNLEQYVESKQPDEQDCLFQFSQILSAFEYLIKTAKRMHGDIKPANILIHDRRLKLADFGFSKQFVEENDENYSYRGSPLYTSPQVLEGKAYTTKSEIWSLGVTLYFMLCYDDTDRKNSFPWWGQTDVHLINQIKQFPRLRFSESNTLRLSEEVRVLLQRMLEIEEEARIDWAELFSNPLFSVSELSNGIYNSTTLLNSHLDELNPNNDPTIHVITTDPESAEKQEPYYQQFQALLQQSQDPRLLNQNNEQDQFTATAQSSTGDLDKQSSSQKEESDVQSQDTEIKSTPRIVYPKSNGSFSTESHFNNSSINNNNRNLIISLDVIGDEKHPSPEDFLPKVIENEQQNQLLKELYEFISQKRSLSFFVYNTAKMFKECFVRFKLLEPKNASLVYFESLVLFVLCKRAKVLSEEIVDDIVKKRNAEYLLVEDVTAMRLQMIQQQQQQQMQQKQNAISGKNSYQSEQQQQQQQQQSYDSQLKRTSKLPADPVIEGGLIATTGTHATSQSNTNQSLTNSKRMKFGEVQKRPVVKITKDHWDLLEKKKGIRSAVTDKLLKERQIYRNNFEDYRQQVSKSIINEKTAIADDRLGLDYDEFLLNLQYESIVIEDVFRFFFPFFSEIAARLEGAATSASASDTFEISEEELKYILLLDDFVMIITFESTFRTRPLQKLTDSLDIQQFYFKRSHSHPSFLIQRIATAYKTIFLS